MESEKTSGGDKYSKLAGNTIIFAISSFSSKLLTLIVQPFLTYAMAEISDLGLSKILSQYANLLIPFVSMGMSNAIIRFGLDKGNSEKQVFTNGLLTILGGFGILVLCWPVAQFLPDMAQYGLLIYIYVLMSCLRTLCTQFVRSRQWNKLVAVDGVLCTVATMAFYVLYLVGFKWGANGYLLAIISGDLVSVLFLMFTGRLWDFIELKGINKTLWKQMLRFSLPMIPAQISFWIINASDLFFVREMCDGLDGHLHRVFLQRLAPDLPAGRRRQCASGQPGLHPLDAGSGKLGFRLHLRHQQPDEQHGQQHQRFLSAARQQRPL